MRSTNELKNYNYFNTCAVDGDIDYSIKQHAATPPFPLHTLPPKNTINHTEMLPFTLYGYILPIYYLLVTQIVVNVMLFFIIVIFLMRK